MTQCKLHITQENERWDTLAWNYYGDAYLYPQIIAANPHISLSYFLPAGLTVVIPLLDQAATNTAGLPPWMS